MDWPDCCWGKILVDGAVGVARGWGVSESVIGLTILAIGSSLPELATSIVAARKGKSDIVIGNVVGSNIFNIFLVLGVSATIKPLPFQVSSNMDESMVVGITIILFLFTTIRKTSLFVLMGSLFDPVCSVYDLFTCS